MKDIDQEQYTKLRRKLVVHIHALHKDAQNQPSLACDSGELAAELKAVSKRHKLLLDEVKAEADRDIRNSQGNGVCRQVGHRPPFGCHANRQGINRC